VDQSTAAARRALCEREVQLNRALGSTLYEGVVGLSSEGAVVEASDATAVEYAVHMRRFEAAQEADCALREGRITTSHFDELAHHLCAVHDTCQRAPDDAVPTEQRDQMDNIDYLQQHGVPSKLVDEAHVAELRRWLQTQGNTLAPLIAARRQQGFVRLCHGDLHLTNLTLIDDKLRPFDCLEFNDALRTVDVLCDVAFLVMDLDSRGRSDLSWSFLSSYLEATGDYASLPLLHYYCAYRTLVRAKVAAISQDAAKVALHVQLALQYARQSAAHQPPLLVAMGGVSGTGKSFVSGHLVPWLQAVRVRSDVERKRLAGLTSLENSAKHELDIYTPQYTARTRERLHDIASIALKSSVSCIVDATNSTKAQREDLRSVAAAEGARYVAVWCTANTDVLVQRVQQRKLIGKDASEASEQVLFRQLQAVEPCTEDEGPLYIVDTTSDWTPEQVKALAQKITKRD
jgi:aminoglycoside phosphotransferase family enzyme/predicted kinase